MAGKKKHGQRPPRMLNLNKSPATNKLLYPINSIQSPLLRLPIELRCRIWDYVLGSNTIHIAPVYKKVRYQLYICKCPDKYDNPSPAPRVTAHAPRPDTTLATHLTHHMESHRDCLFNNPQKPSVGSFSLHFLLTCRQVYHEAALKPFSQTFFSYVGMYYPMLDNAYGLRPFLDALNNTQARALAILRLSLGGYLSTQTFAKLSGLKRLHLEIPISHLPNYPAIRELKPHGSKKWIKEIARLQLKSLRISCDVECTGLELTKAQEKPIETWLERAEIEWIRRK